VVDNVAGNGCIVARLPTEVTRPGAGAPTKVPHKHSRYKGKYLTNIPAIKVNTSQTFPLLR